MSESKNPKPIVSLTNDVLARIVKQDVKPSYVEAEYPIETEDAIYNLELRIPSNLLSTNSLREEVSTWSSTWFEKLELFLADEEYSISPAIDEVARLIIDTNNGEVPSIEIISTVGYVKKCLKEEPDDVTALYMLVGNSVATQVYSYINQALSNNDLESLLGDISKAKKD